MAIKAGDPVNRPSYCTEFATQGGMLLRFDQRYVRFVAGDAQLHAPVVFGQQKERWRLELAATVLPGSTAPSSTSPSIGALMTNFASQLSSRVARFSGTDASARASRAVACSRLTLSSVVSKRARV